MRRFRIIAFVGIDGAGKSTAARGLAAWLDEHDVPARYAQNPGGRRFFTRLAHRVGRRDAVELLGRRGFLLVEVVLRWLAIARGLLIAALTGRVAVMDRYSYCQYVAAKARRHGGERLIRALYRIFPRPDIVFFLTLPPAEAQRRVALRGVDSEELGDLVAADAAYRSLPEASWFTVVDAAAGPADVAAAITDALGTAGARSPR